MAMKDEEWKVLDRKALGMIRLSLAASVAFNISKENKTKELMDAFVSIRSHSWIAAGVSLRPISLCHYLFIKGDQMEENSKQYRSNSETRPDMHRQVRS
jgi:hypothetical protein